MRSSWLCLLGFLASSGYAVDSSTSSDSLQFTTLTGTISVGFSPSSSTASSTSGSGSTQSTSTSTTTTEGSTSTITVLVGGVGLETLSVINGTTTLYPNTTTTTSTTHSTTASSTTTSVQPTNTQPCNGWTEFCERQYGNVTEVAAHNAWFHIAGNAASNQIYGLTTQLNDGIRMRE